MLDSLLVDGLHSVVNPPKQVRLHVEAVGVLANHVEVVRVVQQLVDIIVGRSVDVAQLVDYNHELLELLESILVCTIQDLL